MLISFEMLEPKKDQNDGTQKSIDCKHAFIYNNQKTHHYEKTYSLF